MSFFITQALIAFLGGLVPIFIWLWFWEHEDKHPEPKKLIVLALLAGMAAVIFVIPIEKFIVSVLENSVSTLVLWAATEEVLKFLLAYFTVLRRAENDEPIDSVMYMIAVALGFSALENALFIFGPILDGNTGEAILTNGFRFVGATLLHTVASGVIGIVLALSFYKKKSVRRLYITAGVILAILLHSGFNLSIIFLEGSESIFSFYAVWVGLIVMLLLFEKVKSIRKPN